MIRFVPFGRAFIVGTALLLSVTGCTYTRPFTDADGRVIPGSIATMETVSIGGISQSIWFRGVDTRKPAVILLHGGLGVSESALFRHYDAALERSSKTVAEPRRWIHRKVRAMARGTVRRIVNVPLDEFGIGERMDPHSSRGRVQRGARDHHIRSLWYQNRSSSEAA